QVSSGFHSRQSRDPNERHRCSTSKRRSEALFPRIKLHLSAGRLAADKGRVTSDRSVGNNESMVRGGQNSWHQNVPSVQKAIRLQCNLIDADKSIWTARQRRPGDISCSPRVASKVSRSECNRSTNGYRVGHGHTSPRTHACQRSGKGRPVLDEVL